MQVLSGASEKTREGRTMRRARRVASAFFGIVACTTMMAACGGDQGGNGGGGEGQGGNDDRRGKASGGDAGAGQGPITNVDEILSSDDERALVGRRVDIEGVDVIETTKKGGALLIGPAGDEGVAVVLPPSTRSTDDGGGSTTDGESTGGDSSVVIETGQSADVQGVVRVTPKTYDEAVRRFAMKKGQFEFVQDEEVFVLSGSTSPA